MEEQDVLRRAVDELHEPERLADLLVARLEADRAPKDLVDRFRRDRDALLTWLGA